nr:hypothetical protein [Microbacterium sp. ANT_H45B]
MSATDGSAAASARGTLVGAATSASAGARTYSAAPPSVAIDRKAITASPTAKPSTSSPRALIVPETS